MPPLSLRRLPAGPFVALDFETADRLGDSACQVGLVRVEDGRIVERRQSLIRPPRLSFPYAVVHGITWRHVKDSPTFAQAWPGLAAIFEGAAFIAAHNSGFDQHVLETCCALAKLAPPPLPYLCTVQLARKTWRLPSCSLPEVCRHLGVPLRHHDAASDAEACARIVMAVQARPLSRVAR